MSLQWVWAYAKLMYILASSLFLTPNRSLDRNVLISIVILLLLAVLCPSAAVFSSVPSRRSPLRLRQNGIKTVRHKYIIRLSSNDRFGLTGQTPSTLTAAWSPLRCNKPHFALQNGAYCNAKGHVLHRKTWPFANLLITSLLSVADRQRNGSACPSVRFPCVYSRLHRPHGAGCHAEDALCVVVGHLHIPQYKVEDVG